MSAVDSLEQLSLTAVVRDGCIYVRHDLRTLPRTILQKLLLVSVNQSRILCIRNLITNWPLNKLVLHECRDFDQTKAVLLAYCLQEMRSNLTLVDLRGCSIGIEGTTAFCKLAVNIPVSQNDVSDMRILDTRPSHPKVFNTGQPPVVVTILDCVVNDSNFELVLQAIRRSSVMELKISHLTLRELGRRKVSSLLSYLEPDMVSGLDLKMNVLETKGITDIASFLLSFTNLTDLNLAYNGLTHQDLIAIEKLASICGSFEKLKKLNLSGNCLRSGVTTILRSLKSPLMHLSLSGCGIKDDELRAMCSMDTLASLRSLELCTSGLANCPELLCRFVLRSSETIEDLSVEENMFTTESISLLCQTIKQLHLLKRLSLCYNHFLSDDIRTLRKEFPSIEIINRDWLN